MGSKITLSLMISTVMQVDAAVVAKTATIFKNDNSLNTTVEEVYTLNKTTTLKELDYFYGPRLTHAYTEAYKSKSPDFFGDNTAKNHFETERIEWMKATDDLAVIDVSGKVVDENGKPISGAIIKVKGTKLVTTTRQAGVFQFKNLDDKSILVISCLGFEEREVKAKEKLGDIELKVSNTNIDQVDVTVKKQVGTMVDLKNRSHQNLGQILEGGVPGLTLKPAITTVEGEIDIVGAGNSRYKTVREMYEFSANNPATTQEFLAEYPTYEEYKRKLNLTSNPSAYRQGASSTVNSGLVPQLRGVTNFATGPSGMLVVIDGFPQEDFPSDYPMNNVESIEVVSDPEECLKWGPKASGGVIFITTKQGESGKVQINYSSNYYYSTPSDNSAKKLQLASSADVLDYYKEVYDRGLASYDPNTISVKPGSLRPAESYLFDLGKGYLSEEAFQHKWDSLGLISNRQQLRSLQQNVLNQNHSLIVSGGSPIYQFSLNGMYRKNMQTELGSKDRDLGLDIKNNLRLLQGKIKARWLVNVNNSQGYKGDHNMIEMDPYQLFFDEYGDYVYYYKDAALDTRMRHAGYFNTGLNLYEDLISNRTERNTNKINTSLNVDYQIFKSLSWTTDFKLSKSKTVEGKLTKRNSSVARELFNEYGVPQFNDPNDLSKATDVNFYVPIGDFYKASNSDEFEYRITSGLSFKQQFLTNHSLYSTLNLGLGSVESKNIPRRTIYGYNLNREYGIPFLNSQTSDLRNFTSNTLDFNKLNLSGIDVLRYERKINLNGDLGYSFKNRYGLNFQYLSSYTPNYGHNPSYAATSSKQLALSWNLGLENFIVNNMKFIDDLKFTLSATDVSIPKLSADQVSGSRFEQPLWNNSTIIINSFNFAEQSGQTNRSVSGEVESGMFGNLLSLKLKYSQHTLGEPEWNGRLSYDIAKSPYFKFPLISTLRFNMALQNINPYQGMRIMMEANSVTNGGGGSVPITGVQGLLPPSKLNKEASLELGLLDDQYTVSLSYYNQTTAGLAQGRLPTDPSSGLQSKVNYSRISNEGITLGVNAYLIKRPDFEWRLTINGSYNVNKALQVPEEPFSLSATYLTASRNGYTTDNLWSFHWAGLDSLGNPQFYNSQMEKVAEPDVTSVIYSGNTRAPYSGGIFNDWQYKNVFFSARLVFNYGHVMRRYMPKLTPEIDRNILIASRWRKPGDEYHTDVPAIAKYNETRAIVTQNSSNNILSADNIRFTEVQVGYDIPSHLLKSLFFKNLTISAQVENLALWTRNKFGIDPDAVSNNGTVGLSRPTNYILSIKFGL
ncbi:carboxypeptidase-like regulatory domain-containing protein [Sphingobacterium sp. xlx-130]|uniref:carboxypeptidase-like regulatory domain-containing protein n=1 Tax=Sphingobacterium sp. xlx-130 TaxID=2654323 RepID=UPI001969C453|nr:carboxypeptidase-like regulatory domain-containing protein [Sphingobacterium sp. xlx-130]